MLVLMDGKLVDMFGNPVEGVLKLLGWVNERFVFCPSPELVCANEGFELNSGAD